MEAYVGQIIEQDGRENIGKQRDTYHRDISPSESTTCPYKQEQNEQGERRANHQRAEILHLYLSPVVCQ